MAPRALSEAGTAGLVRARLPTADDGFCRACHAATGGNRLLVAELARALAAEGGTGLPREVRFDDVKDAPAGPARPQVSFPARWMVRSVVPAASQW